MKIFKYTNGEYKAFGFRNIAVLYGKNSKSQYRIELKLDLGVFDAPSLPIYSGDKRPLLRSLNLISIPVFVLSPVFIVGIFIFSLIGIYIEGAINFFRDTAWQQSVRAFNWANVVLVVLLTISLIVSML